MDWGQAFKIANMVALLCWIAIIAFPRIPQLTFAIQRIVIGSLCLVYSVVVSIFFFQVEGGGFGTIEQVKILFSSDAVVFAGWLHYLAFDLFVGLWITERADSRKIYRWIQAPILFATFMFGPMGLLVYYLIECRKISNNASQ